MSELFGWLSQRERENVTKVPRGRSPHVEIQEVAARAATKERGEGGPPVDLPLPRVEIRSTVQFDIESADYRLKQVLDPVSIVGEQFRRLRATLSLVQKQRDFRILLVTSACPEEGKTFVACGLAGVLSREPGRRVLLVDADLRKPRVASLIGIKANPGALTGLSEVLREEIDLMESIAGSVGGGLFFLATGKIPTNPSELLTSPLLDKGLRTARSVFDWVVIDSPPVLSLSDASVIASACDAALLVVRANRTHTKLVKEAAQRIGPEKICGLVMNRVRRLKSSSYYHYHREKTSG